MSPWRGLTNRWIDQTCKRGGRLKEKYQDILRNVRHTWHLAFTDFIFYHPDQGEVYVRVCVCVSYCIYISDRVMVGDLSVWFWVTVPVRGGSADRTDAVVLGVSEPPLHWHALSFGELVRPSARTHTHTHTHTHTLYSIKHSSSIQDS